MMNYIRTKTYMYDIFIVIYLYECHKLLFLLNVIYYVYKTFEPHMDVQVTWVATYNKHHNTILFLFCETLLLRKLFFFFARPCYYANAHMSPHSPLWIHMHTLPLWAPMKNWVGPANLEINEVTFETKPAYTSVGTSSSIKLKGVFFLYHGGIHSLFFLKKNLYRAYEARYQEEQWCLNLIRIAYGYFNSLLTLLLKDI